MAKLCAHAGPAPSSIATTTCINMFINSPGGLRWLELAPGSSRGGHC